MVTIIEDYADSELTYRELTAARDSFFSLYPYHTLMDRLLDYHCTAIVSGLIYEATGRTFSPFSELRGLTFSSEKLTGQSNPMGPPR
jgi:hypothetical protein